jgi:hypothetical protein
LLYSFNNGSFMAQYGNSKKQERTRMDEWESAFSEVLRQWGTYSYLVLLAIWGGTVSYIRRMKRGGLPFSLAELIGEAVVSGFIGLSTAYLCKANNIDFYESAFLIGMSGYMGGTGLSLLARVFESKIKTLAVAVFGPGAVDDKTEGKQ